MGGCIDMTGQRYGRLTVIERSKNNSDGRACWLCRCDCGNEVTVLGKMLRNGDTKSCGCYQKELQSGVRLIDMVGKRFGKWTVLCRDTTEDKENNTGGIAYWICKCDCGTLKSVNGVSLRRGISKSCGCDVASTASRRNTKDLSGTRFGTLTVLCRTPYVPGHRFAWVCLCDCGKMVLYNTSQLQTYRSCGCAHEESAQRRFDEYRAIHGNPRDRLYHVWTGMRNRCMKPNNKEYQNYGGRGISVCDEWANSYPAFRDWAYANGYDDTAPTGKCTLDRIDVNGNYCPDNCRWVDIKRQSNNRRKCRYFEINGVNRSLGDWCDIYGVDRTMVYGRIKRGWDIERALTEPKHIKTC